MANKQMSQRFERVGFLFAACWLGIALSTSPIYVSRAGLEAEICTSPSQDYTISNLTQGIWTITAKTENCVGNYKGGAKVNCTYSLAFCDVVEGNVSVSVHTFNGTGKNQTIKYDVGYHVDNPFLTAGSSLTGSFQAIYPVGTNYTKKDKTQCELSAVILFRCNRLVPWIAAVKQNSTVVPRTPTTSVTFNPTSCQVYFTFEYEGACTGLLPSGSSKDDLSAGSVLIIIFFVFLTAYFAIGIIINLLRGFRGKDVLPQSEFWIELPVLVADGCIFTCRCGKQEESQYDSI